jgi:hypothetical protein
VRALLVLLALSLLPARAGAEASTLPSEKKGACALLTAADAQLVWNVPMAFQARVTGPGNAGPGRYCAYEPVRPAPGPRTVALQLLDMREWLRLKARAESSRTELEGVKGVGDEAYVVNRKKARRDGALILFVRRRSGQFSVRITGAGLELTDPMRQLARSVAGRL